MTYTAVLSALALLLLLTAVVVVGADGMSIKGRLALAAAIGGAWAAFVLIILAEPPGGVAPLTLFAMAR